jgi:putative ABC transport system permease protein
MKTLHSLSRTKPIEWVIIISFAIGISAMSLGLATFQQSQGEYYFYYFGDPLKQGTFSIETDGNDVTELLDTIVRLTEDGVFSEVYFQEYIRIGMKTYPVFGVYYKNFPLMQLPLVGGRNLSPADIGEGRLYVVMGQDSLASLAPGAQVGDTISIGEAEYEVIGVIGKPRADRTRFRNSIFVPLTSGFSLFGASQFSGAFLTSSREGLDAVIGNNPLEDTPHVIRASIGKAMSEKDAESHSFMPVLILTGTIMLVASINAAIMATFWVMSKQREISIRQAFGAKMLDVAKQIVVQLLFLWVLASLMSILIHILAVVIYYFRGMSLPFGSSNGIALLASGILALASCIVPLRQTFRITPVEAFQKGE